MTVVATGFPAEERIATFGCFFIEVNAWLRIRRGNRQLVEMKRRKDATIFWDGGSDPGLKRGKGRAKFTRRSAMKQNVLTRADRLFEQSR
jgi:hypothetical protein